MSTDATRGTSAAIDAYIRPNHGAGDAVGNLHNSASPTTREFNDIYRSMTGQASLGDRIDQVLATGYRGPVENPNSTADVRANVFAILDRVAAAGNDTGSAERSFNMPTRDDLLNRPIDQLRSQLDSNNAELKQTVDPNLAQLQENYLGFHGTTSDGMKGINQSTELGMTMSLHVATSAERSTNATEWLANTSQSLMRASLYATDQRGTPVDGGMIAIVDMGPGGRAGQNFGVALDRPTDTYFMGTAAKAGQVPETWNSREENKIKGWLDPSDWSKFQNGVNPNDGTAETFDRNRIAEGFARQAMVKTLLETLGYHVGRENTAAANSDTSSDTTTQGDDTTAGIQREKKAVAEEPQTSEEPSRILQPTRPADVVPKASSSLNDYVRVRRDGTQVLTTEEDMSRAMQQIRQMDWER